MSSFGIVFEKKWHRDVIVFKKLRFQNFVRPHNNAKLAFPNSSGLESVFEKLRSLDGLVWTVGLTVEIKLRFLDGLVWTVGLTVEIKLRSLDGLVWTVGLTVEIKLRFKFKISYSSGVGRVL